MPAGRDLPPGWKQTPTGYRISPEQAQYLEAGLNRGLSTAQTLAAMRKEGLGITTQAAYDYVAVIQGKQLAGERANRVVGNYAPSHADYQQVIAPGPSRYRVTGKITLGPEFGEQAGVHYGFSWSNNLQAIDTHRNNIFESLTNFIQSLKAQFPDESLDIGPDSIEFYSFESFTDYPPEVS